MVGAISERSLDFLVIFLVIIFIIVLVLVIVIEFHGIREWDNYYGADRTHVNGCQWPRFWLWRD
jgi:hypothetical protein